MVVEKCCYFSYLFWNNSVLLSFITKHNKMYTRVTRRMLLVEQEPVNYASWTPKFNSCFSCVRSAQSWVFMVLNKMYCFTKSSVLLSIFFKSFFLTYGFRILFSVFKPFLTMVLSCKVWSVPSLSNIEQWRLNHVNYLSGVLLCSLSMHCSSYLDIQLSCTYPEYPSCSLISDIRTNNCISSIGVKYFV